MYNISDFRYLDNEFKKYFKISLRYFIENSYFENVIKLKTRRFENYLSNYNIKFSETNINILQFIKLEYGEEAYGLIKKLI